MERRRELMKKKNRVVCGGIQKKLFLEADKYEIDLEKYITLEEEKNKEFIQYENNQE